jgi:hypothetical protein
VVIQRLLDNIASLFTRVGTAETNITSATTTANSAVQSAQIGTTAVTKTGTRLDLPAYPTTLPANGGTAAGFSGSLSGDVSGAQNATVLAAVNRTNNTSTDTPGSGGTFTAIDTVSTDSKGRVTGVNTKTVTMPTVPTVDTYVLTVNGG